jgi:hypothetical protein
MELEQIDRPTIEPNASNRRTPWRRHTSAMALRLLSMSGCIQKF